MPWNRLDVALLTAPIVAALQASQASGAAWSAKSHDAAKAQLKTALFLAQDSQCAYCRREIRDETGRVEIDHVLPKAASFVVTHANSNRVVHRKQTLGYPQFTFLGQNLVLTCKRCNNKKGTYDARADRTAAVPAAYPVASADYEWVHPYLHDYQAHIDLARGYVFRAANGSAAGRAVIVACKLDTLAAIEVKAMERALKQLPDLESALMRVWTQQGLDNVQAATALSDRFPALHSIDVQAVLERHGRDIAALQLAAAEIRALLP